MLYLLLAICIINSILVFFVFLKKNESNPQLEEKINAISQQLIRLESNSKEDFKMNREEATKIEMTPTPQAYTLHSCAAFKIG